MDKTQKSQRLGAGRDSGATREAGREIPEAPHLPWNLKEDGRKPGWQEMSRGSGSVTFQA